MCTSLEKKKEKKKQNTNVAIMYMNVFMFVCAHINMCVNDDWNL